MTQIIFRCYSAVILYIFAAIMALIKSSVFSDVRGSIGGTTYSRNKSGAIARNRTKPVNPQTAAQTAVRNSFANLATAWRELTDVQRDQWSTMAPLYPYLNKVGEVSTYSGQQLFNKLNNNLASAGLSQINVPLPPAGFLPWAFDPIVADISTNDITTEWSPTDAGYSFNFYATPRMSSGIANLKKYYKQIATFASDATAVDLKAGYLSVYGIEPADMVLGDNIYMKVEAINNITGQRQLVVEMKVTVQA